MKTLVVIRHGAYVLDREARGLTEQGREQIRTACKKLARFSGQDIFMLVSETERTIESAAIIAEALRVPADRIERSSGFELVDDAMAEKVRAKFDVADVLIVVAHEATASHLPAFLALDPDLIPSRPVEKGGGVIMDWETKALEWF